jgi:hypothetical protein
VGVPTAIVKSGREQPLQPGKGKKVVPSLDDFRSNSSASSHSSSSSSSSQAIVGEMTVEQAERVSAVSVD